MSSRNKIHIIVLTLFCSLLLVNLSAQPKRKSHIRQANPAFADTVTPADSDKIKSISDTFPALPDSILIRPDSLLKSVDSILVDSVMTDTVQAPPPKKSPLEDVVKYTANDSIVFLGNNPAFLIHNTKINKKGDWNIFLKYVLLYTIVGQYLRALAEGLVLSESQTFSIFGMKSEAKRS